MTVFGSAVMKGKKLLKRLINLVMQCELPLCLMALRFLASFSHLLLMVNLYVKAFFFFSFLFEVSVGVVRALCFVRMQARVHTYIQSLY